MRHKISVTCTKCGEQSEIEELSGFGDPSLIFTEGAQLAPYLAAILEAVPERKHIPQTTISACAKCVTAKSQSVEGDTFRPKKRKSRGKFVHASALADGMSSSEQDGAESEADTDQALTVAAYGNSRRQPSLFGHELLDRQNAGDAHTMLADPDMITSAEKVLDGMTLAEISESLGVTRSIARRRDFRAARPFAEIQSPFRTAPQPRISAPKCCPHSVRLASACSICQSEASAKSRKAR
jgi:hypothetical protein